MARLEIKVTGTGSAIRRAERGMLVLQAQSQQQPTTEEASAALNLILNKFRDAIAPYCPHDEQTGRTKDDAAISHYSIGTFDTSNHRDRQSDSGFMMSKASTYHTTYSARTEVSLDFSDFNALNTLATQFSAMDNIRIERVRWHLTDATLASVRVSARKQAAQDALQRAQDYAEIFANLSTDDAVQKVKAIDVKETPAYQQSTRPLLHYGRKQIVKKERFGGRAELYFEPQDVRLEVKIEGKFVVEGGPTSSWVASHGHL